MKRYLFIIFSIFILVSLYSKEMFVITKICPVMSEPKASSSKVGILKSSDKVAVIKDEGEWIKIKTSSIDGYIQKIFLGDNPSIEYKSNADKMADMSNVEVRKRSNVYSSSAAATRGLTTESIRDRENVSFKNYDFESIKWLEQNFTYSTEEILEFAQKNLN